MGVIRSKPLSISIVNQSTLGQVSVLNVETEDPTNPSALYGEGGIGPLRSIKHHAIIENSVPGHFAPTDSEKKIVLFSGDWTYAFPINQRSDYPPNPYWSDDGRQEMWYADTGASALNSGTIRFKLAQNHYHNYPWNGSTGYFGPGRPGGGIEPQRGPFMPDGIGFIIDKRGQYWMGPCTVGYNQVTGDAAGEAMNFWAPMYKWSMPDKHPTTGVRLGGSGDGTKGWSRPNQNRLKNPGNFDGVQGVDWDIGYAFAGESLGAGRPNTTAYDPVTDSIYVVGMQGTATTLNPVLYKMSLDPAVVAEQGGKYLWTRTLLPAIPLSQLGVTGTTEGFNDSTSSKNGLIANTVVCNGKLYFTFLGLFNNVTGGNGNVDNKTRRTASWILSINLSNPQAAPATWIPFPQNQNWWLRLWDGPQAAISWPFQGGMTPAQYRSMKAVGNYIVLGPDRWTKVDEDPWICAYDTISGTWKTWLPPASYQITNGGHDWPNSIFSLVAIPSLGEVWLAGCVTEGDFGDAFGTASAVANKFHDWRPESNAGKLPGRRIIRFKIT